MSVTSSQLPLQRYTLHTSMYTGSIQASMYELLCEGTYILCISATAVAVPWSAPMSPNRSQPDDELEGPFAEPIRPSSSGQLGSSGVDSPPCRAKKNEPVCSLAGRRRPLPAAGCCGLHSCPEGATELGSGHDRDTVNRLFFTVAVSHSCGFGQNSQTECGQLSGLFLFLVRRSPVNYVKEKKKGRSQYVGSLVRESRTESRQRDPEEGQGETSIASARLIVNPCPTLWTLLSAADRTLRSASVRTRQEARENRANKSQPRAMSLPRTLGAGLAGPSRLSSFIGQTSSRALAAPSIPRPQELPCPRCFGTSSSVGAAEQQQQYSSQRRDGERGERGSSDGRGGRPGSDRGQRGGRGGGRSGGGGGNSRGRVLPPFETWLKSKDAEQFRITPKGPGPHWLGETVSNRRSTDEALLTGESV